MVFLLFLACGFSFGMLFSFPIVIQDRDDLSYLKSSAGEITILTPENKTYTEPDSGYYPATFGFENEVDGTNGTAIDFVDIDDSDGGCYVEIRSQYNTHKKILALIDDGAGMNHVSAYPQFSSKEYGTMECWLWNVGHPYNIYTEFWNGASPLGGLRTGSDWVRYDDDGWTVISGAPTPVAGTWNHIRIDFRCGATEYMGLNQWDFQIWINGEVYGPYTFGSNLQPDRQRFSTMTSGGGAYTTYADAVGYSWDPNYSIGDNLNEGLLLSYENTTSLDWKGYSLDNHANKTIMGYTTIPMPMDGTHSIQVFGNDSIDTMYESSKRYFTVDTAPYINIITPENKTYFDTMSGYYPATFGFENDEDTTIPEEWIVNTEGSMCLEDIQHELDGHNKVLRLYDPSTTYACGVWSNFENQTAGSIEFWFEKTSGASACYIVLMDEGIQSILMQIDVNNNGLFQLYTGESVTAGYSDNQWFHLRIQFNCLTNKFNVFINGNQEFFNMNYFNPSNFINKLGFTTNSFYAGTVYVDAIGYSWDPNYEIGDNFNEGLLLGYDSNVAHNWTGFSLDGGANNTILGNTTIPMPADGGHNIQVYGNDTMGTMYESSVRYFTTNALGPSITINSPILNSMMGTVAPSYALTIPDGDLDDTWYSLDGGTTTIPFIGLSGTIDQTEWDKVGNGTATITFYANDSVSNIGQAEVMVRKDIIAPVIIITDPSNTEEFEFMPIYDITVNEPNLDDVWYTIDEGAYNYSISETVGTINVAAWNSAPSGPVTIRFYARDLAGNIGTSFIIVVKTSAQQQPPPGIAGYDLYLLLGTIGIISTLIIRKRVKS